MQSGAAIAVDSLAGVTPPVWRIYGDHGDGSLKNTVSVVRVRRRLVTARIPTTEELVAEMAWGRNAWIVATEKQPDADRPLQQGAPRVSQVIPAAQSSFYKDRLGSRDSGQRDRGRRGKLCVARWQYERDHDPSRVR